MWPEVEPADLEALWVGTILGHCRFRHFQKVSSSLSRWDLWNWVRRFASGFLFKRVGFSCGYEMKMGVESWGGIWLRNGNFMMEWRKRIGEVGK